MAEIGELPGVSAAEVAALAQLTLHTTDDLLRTERGALARRVPGLSLATIRRWQAAAELIQLRDLTIAEASALVAAGVDSLDELAGWSLARLRSVLPGRDDEALFDLAKDVMRLRHTGVVNGNVRLADGTPVVGASVSVGGVEASTDPRGRFRVIRLALDRSLTVTVTHPSLGAKRVSGVAVLRSAALQAVTVVLSGRRRTLPALSERRGDRLPPVGSSVVTTTAESTPPESDDLLLMLDHYANGDGKVVSAFLDFEAGRFVRRTYRLPAAALPAGVSAGDHLRWTGGSWQLTKNCSRDAPRRSRLRAAERRLGPPPTTVEAARAQARALLKAASDPKRGTR